jgi:hypothetical protein
LCAGRGGTEGFGCALHEGGGVVGCAGGGGCDEGVREGGGEE